jgi:anti-sigma factor RsiW
MRLALRRRAPACVEVVELVTDYLEGSLPRRVRRGLEAHLADCEHCTEYLAQMRVTIRLTGRLREQDLPPQMRVELAELFRSWRGQIEPPPAGGSA